jgi:hypothetical protein
VVNNGVRCRFKTLWYRRSLMPMHAVRLSSRTIFSLINADGLAFGCRRTFLREWGASSRTITRGTHDASTQRSSDSFRTARRRTAAAIRFSQTLFIERVECGFEPLFDSSRRGGLDRLKRFHAGQPLGSASLYVNCIGEERTRVRSRVSETVGRSMRGWSWPLTSLDEPRLLICTL